VGETTDGRLIAPMGSLKIVGGKLGSSSQVPLRSEGFPPLANTFFENAGLGSAREQENLSISVQLQICTSRAPCALKLSFEASANSLDIGKGNTNLVYFDL
jgi:hypothetical protein